jgi:putative transposase
MPWSEITPMEQKVQFIADYLRETYSITELCERYRISRKTGYKWISRFIEEGPPGLKRRPSSPKTIPHRTDQTVIDALLALRQKHPS